MKEINEYRKTSAEFVRLKYRKQWNQYWLDGKEFCNWSNWTPDTNLNQMGMIEDKLIEEEVDVETRSYLGYIYDDNEITDRPKTHVIKLRNHCGESFMGDSGEGESRPIAFMKAFMDYINK
ncbi:unnamed protein product [marine sediment metagenome]|uniref:Uncharacterized protein n=1 Tax=marine sediment metagenome TaxID=412755 RepID=X1DDF4_9ZZZZ